MTEQAASKGRLDLFAPSRIGDGMQLIQWPVDQYDLAAEVQRLLVAKNFTKAPVSLESLHFHIPVGMQIPDKDGLNAVTRAFYETDAAFKSKYLGVIQHIARQVLPFEFLFQETPTMRFHFPVRFEQFDGYRDQEGRLLSHHNDGMLGHALEEINCWLPFTNCRNTGTLQIASLRDSIRLLDEFCGEFDHDAATFHHGRERYLKRLLHNASFRQANIAATKPYDMKYGEALLFESRCIHGTAENEEKTTRVSIDFRVIPLEAYKGLKRSYASVGRSKRRFERGDVFAKASSAEL